MKSLSHKKLVIYIVVTLLVLAACFLYYIFDPNTNELFPKCFFLQATGYQCPGCGSQRMFHALLHVDFASAWQANALLTTATVCSIGYGLAILVLPKIYASKLKEIVQHRLFFYALIGIVILWWIGRNI